MQEIAALEKTATEQDDCILHFQMRVAEMTAENEILKQNIQMHWKRHEEMKAEVERLREALKEIDGWSNAIKLAQAALKEAI